MTPEHREHLRKIAARGHRRRAERAAVRTALKTGAMTLEQVLDHPAAAALELERLLLWLPGHGPRTLPRVLGRANVSPTRVVGTLTPRERGALLELVHT
jgi:hypothetical protein